MAFTVIRLKKGEKKILHPKQTFAGATTRGFTGFSSRREAQFAIKVLRKNKSLKKGVRLKVVKV